MRFIRHDSDSETMKPKRRASIDGFVPRTPQRRVGTASEHLRPLESVRLQESKDDEPQGLSRDISDSLRGIDALGEPEQKTPPKRRFRLFRRKRDRDRKSTSERTAFQKWRKRVVVLLILLVVVGVGYMAAKVIGNVSKITHGDLLSLITPGTPLNTDGQGRTNILIFGTSQDDAAHQNASGGGGLWLTDSIMVVSMNQTAHTVTMISIPRDLWVSMPNDCAVGNQAKINAVYECGADLLNSDASAQKANGYSDQDKKGAQALQSTIQHVTGLSMQYYVHANYSVLQQSVDAVGGVQVNIQGDGASGVYDTNFDWDCPGARSYTCKNVYYPHDGTYTLDGRHALLLARARGDFGLYSYKDFGLNRGDFDRQINQQKILDALKAKILSTGTLLNPVALTGLFDALGNNITTDIQGGNYKTLIEFVKKMPKDNAMRSVSLGGATGDSPLVTGDMVDGQSVEVPVAGASDFSAIVAYIARQLSTNPAVAENATISIYNASGQAGVAGKLQQTLAAKGMNILSIGDASAAAAGSTQYTIYDTTGGKKPQTMKFLKSQLSGSTTSTAAPKGITSDADIVIVIGPSSSASTSQ